MTRPLDCSMHYLACRRTTLRVCRMPAQHRPDKPLALFVSGLFADLDRNAAWIAPLTRRYDVVACELPGHGESAPVGEISLDSFAREYASLIDCYVTAHPTLTVIGESLGGLVAAALGPMRPERIERVILLDPPFHLTRPNLRKLLARAWHGGGSAYQRSVLQAIFGFDPTDERVLRETPLHHLPALLPQDAILLAGSPIRQHVPPQPLPASLVSAQDLALLQVQSPSLRIPPRLPAAGHCLMIENPTRVLSEIDRLLPPPAPIEGYRRALFTDDLATLPR